jgi:hypothetical protein
MTYTSSAAANPANANRLGANLERARCFERDLTRLDSVDPLVQQAIRATDPP